MISFNVSVIPMKLMSIRIAQYPDRTYYEVGEPFDTSGMVVMAMYNDGREYEVKDYEVTGYQEGYAGFQTLTVRYLTQSASIWATTSEGSPESLSIWKQPDQITYEVGGSFDATGMVVKAHYKSGFSKEVTGYSVGTLPTGIGSGTVLITYKGTSVELPVTMIEPTLQSLELTKKPEKLSYRIGERIDLTGMEITAIDSTGHRHALSNGDCTMLPVSTDEAGIKTITMLYQGLTVSFEIQVEEPAMTGIRVEKPYKQIYALGQEFESYGMHVYASYDDGSEKEVDIKDCLITGYTGKIGNNIITVKYRDYQYKFYVVVKDTTPTADPGAAIPHPSMVPAVKSMTLLSEPDQKEFVCGTAFNFSGCKARIEYTDGQILTVDVTEDQTAGGNINTVGDQTITFLRDGAELTFRVTVVPVKVTGITITQKPNKTVYQLGEKFDPAGMVVTAEKNDGTKAEIKNYSVSALENTTGSQTITVSYLGLKQTVDVTVEDMKPDSISVWKQPDKTTYYMGQRFDPTGMILRVHYKNGYTVDVKEVETDVLLSTAGQQDVTVTYQEQTTTVSVTVMDPYATSVELIRKPKKLSYKLGEKIDLTGLEVEAMLSDGSIGDAGEYTMIPVSMEEAGTKTVTLLYDNGLSVSFEIRVDEPEISKLRVTKPAKLKYIEGEEFDPAGMKVMVCYVGGKEKEVEDYTFSGYTGKVGIDTIKVRYKTYGYSFYVTIEKKPEPSMEPETTPKADAGSAPSGSPGSAPWGGTSSAPGNTPSSVPSSKPVNSSVSPDVPSKAPDARQSAQPGSTSSAAPGNRLGVSQDTAPSGTPDTGFGVVLSTSPVGSDQGTDAAEDGTAPSKFKEGQTFSAGKLTYRAAYDEYGMEKLIVTGLSESGKTAKIIVIPAQIYMGSEAYQVTEIGAKAFAGCKQKIKIVCKNKKLKKANLKKLKKSGYKKFR